MRPDVELLVDRERCLQALLHEVRDRVVQLRRLCPHTNVGRREFLTFACGMRCVEDYTCADCGELLSRRHVPKKEV